MKKIYDLRVYTVDELYFDIQQDVDPEMNDIEGVCADLCLTGFSVESSKGQFFVPGHQVHHISIGDYKTVGVH